MPKNTTVFSSGRDVWKTFEFLTFPAMQAYGPLPQKGCKKTVTGKPWNSLGNRTSPASAANASTASLRRHPAGILGILMNPFEHHWKTLRFLQPWHGGAAPGPGALPRNPGENGYSKLWKSIAKSSFPAGRDAGNNNGKR